MLAGRIAVTMSTWTGWAAAAVVDLAFLLAVGTAVAREIVATLVGSIGLIAAVPITTALAAWLSGSESSSVR